jgi:hypothetical protein
METLRIYSNVKILSSCETKVLLQVANLYQTDEWAIPGRIPHDKIFCFSVIHVLFLLPGLVLSSWTFVIIIIFIFSLFFLFEKVKECRMI